MITYRQGKLRDWFSAEGLKKGFNKETGMVRVSDVERVRPGVPKDETVKPE